MHHFSFLASIDGSTRSLQYWLPWSIILRTWKINQKRLNKMRMVCYLIFLVKVDNFLNFIQFQDFTFFWLVNYTNFDPYTSLRPRMQRYEDQIYIPIIHLLEFKLSEMIWRILGPGPGASCPYNLYRALYCQYSLSCGWEYGSEGGVGGQESGVLEHNSPPSLRVGEGEAGGNPDVTQLGACHSQSGTARSGQYRVGARSGQRGVGAGESNFIR